MAYFFSFPGPLFAVGIPVSQLSGLREIHPLSIRTKFMAALRHREWFVQEMDEKILRDLHRHEVLGSWKKTFSKALALLPPEGDDLLKEYAPPIRIRHASREAIRRWVKVMAKLKGGFIPESELRLNLENAFGNISKVLMPVCRQNLPRASAYGFTAIESKSVEQLFEAPWFLEKMSKEVDNIPALKYLLMHDRQRTALAAHLLSKQF